MKKNLFNALATVLLISTISGCSKEPKDLLTAHDWKVSSFLIEKADGTTTDYLASSESCDKDNFFTFLENGTMVQDEGPTKCETTDPQTIDGHWALSNNDENLTVDIGGDMLMTILALETDLLKTTYSELDLIDSTTSVITITWVTKE